MFPRNHREVKKNIVFKSGRFLPYIFIYRRIAVTTPLYASPRSPPAATPRAKESKKKKRRKKHTFSFSKSTLPLHAATLPRREGEAAAREGRGRSQEKGDKWEGAPVTVARRQSPHTEGDAARQGQGRRGRGRRARLRQGSAGVRAPEIVRAFTRTRICTRLRALISLHFVVYISRTRAYCVMHIQQISRAYVREGLLFFA